MSRPHPARRRDPDRVSLPWARRPRLLVPVLRRHARRLLAAVIAGCVVGGSVHLLGAGSDPGQVPVVVARRALPVGTVITEGDVTVRRLPSGMQPARGVGDLTVALGARLAVPVGAGEVLTTADLRTSQLLVGQPAGTVAVFVPLTDPVVAAALRGGDRVDLHSPVDGEAVVAAVLVLTGPVSTGERDPPGVWVAVDAGQARAVAAARGADPVGGALQVALHAAEG